MKKYPALSLYRDGTYRLKKIKREPGDIAIDRPALAAYVRGKLGIDFLIDSRNLIVDNELIIFYEDITETIDVRWRTSLEISRKINDVVISILKSMETTSMLRPSHVASQLVKGELGDDDINLVTLVKYVEVNKDNVWEVLGDIISRGYLFKKV